MELNFETLYKLCDICCSITYEKWKEAGVDSFSEKKNDLLNGVFSTMREAIKKMQSEGNKEITDNKNKIQI